MPFADILEANRRNAREFDSSVPGVARLGLAIVTCIDSRIDPLSAFGLKPGDAKIIRNAGARVTDDVLRTLIVACHVLGVTRIALIQHTDCGLVKNDQAAIERVVAEHTGRDASAIDFLTIGDQVAALHEDTRLLRECELLPGDAEIGEFIFDVSHGTLEQVA